MPGKDGAFRADSSVTSLKERYAVTAKLLTGLMASTIILLPVGCSTSHRTKQQSQDISMNPHALVEILRSCAEIHTNRRILTREYFFQQEAAIAEKDPILWSTKRHNDHRGFHTPQEKHLAITMRLNSGKDLEVVTSDHLEKNVCPELADHFRSLGLRVGLNCDFEPKEYVFDDEDE